LTPREAIIWDLRRKNNSQSEIGRKLGVSRQAVHKAFQKINGKVKQAFMEAAETINLEVKTINLVEGVMLAYSPAYEIPVIVSLSKANGLKLWYLYKRNCGTCHLESTCHRILKEEAKERGIFLDPADQIIPPTKLALRIFGRY
jgi:DNA-binding XRE family transcriptional regulator